MIMCARLGSPADGEEAIQFVVAYYTKIVCTTNVVARLLMARKSAAPVGREQRAVKSRTATPPEGDELHEIIEYIHDYIYIYMIIYIYIIVYIFYNLM